MSSASISSTIPAPAEALADALALALGLAGALADALAEALGGGAEPLGTTLGRGVARRGRGVGPAGLGCGARAERDDGQDGGQGSKRSHGFGRPLGSRG